MISGVRKIALLGRGFCGWGGGVDFLRFCANALASSCKNCKIGIVLLLPDFANSNLRHKVRSILSRYKNLAIALFNCEKPIKRHKPFSRSQLMDSFKNIEGDLEIVFYPQDKDISTLITSLEVDVVIPTSISLGSSFPTAWVGYLYDFQHKYYPEYFSKREIEARDRHFSQMLSEAKAVIVNAVEVKNDIEKFFPQSQCRIFDLPFCATPIESWFEPSEEDLEKKYNLPKKYFAICNQFWIHKDHTTAFIALAKYTRLTGRSDVHIVCTGRTDDSRHPGYFCALKKTICQLGLIDRVHFLGHVPKKDQIGVMLNSIAVLQPTLFEGGPGGGAVYDAVALGVPAVVSDIPVNREIIDIDSIIFFKAKDADDMAAKMVAIESKTFRKMNKNELLTIGRERTRKFGSRLLEAIEYVASISLHSE